MAGEKRQQKVIQLCLKGERGKRGKFKIKRKEKKKERKKEKKKERKKEKKKEKKNEGGKSKKIPTFELDKHN